MTRRKLDQIDRQILKLLQSRGRITNAELADHCHISPPPCLRRVRMLEESGYIDGYHASLNAELMGFTVTVFLQVKLDSSNETDSAAFELATWNWPMVRECYQTVGDHDYLLKITAPDWDTYQNFVSDEIMAAPHVLRVKSSLARQRVKFLPGVPLEPLFSSSAGKPAS